MASYFEVAFTEVSEQQSQLIIALLSEADYTGFEEAENSLKAYVNVDAFDEAVLKELALANNVNYTLQKIEEQNWNAVWESNFEPVTINDFVAIRAHFHEPISNVAHEIIITPKMSFGTGHHATTSMMIEQMQGIDFNNKSVFDFGTGTGILAILAEKLGAKNVLAADNDDWSINNAAENIANNNCDKIALLKVDDADVKGKYDIILANINKNIILDNFSKLTSRLNSSSFLLLSGILITDENDLLQVAMAAGLKHLKTLQKLQWSCMLFGH